MGLIAYAAIWLALAFLLSMLGALLWKMLGGQIALGGIFYGDHRNGTTYLSIGRIQLFVCVLMVVFDFALGMTARRARQAFPDIRLIWVVLFGVSAVLYLAEKAYALCQTAGISSHKRGNGNVH
jgi:hypothetical protein